MCVHIIITGRGSLVGSGSASYARGPEIDPHIRHILSWKLILKKISRQLTSMQNYPVCNELKQVFSQVRLLSQCHPLTAIFELLSIKDEVIFTEKW